MKQIEIAQDPGWFPSLPQRLLQPELSAYLATRSVVQLHTRARAGTAAGRIDWEVALAPTQNSIQTG